METGKAQDRYFLPNRCPKINGTFPMGMITRRDRLIHSRIPKVWSTTRVTSTTHEGIFGWLSMKLLPTVPGKSKHYGTGILRAWWLKMEKEFLQKMIEVTCKLSR